MAHTKKETISIGWCDNGMVEGRFADGLINTIMTCDKENIKFVNKIRVNGNQIGRQRQVLFDKWADDIKTDWHNNMSLGLFKNNSDKKQDALYPTQKPKELISRFVLASTNEGDTVADYYLGSGTTAKVCQELNRNFIGCDINPKAIEITKARLNGGQ